jgi:hypothetical protein
MNETINEINKHEIKQPQQCSNCIFIIEQLGFIEKNTNTPQNRYTNHNKTKHRKNVKNNTEILVQRTKKRIVQTHILE